MTPLSEHRPDDPSDDPSFADAVAGVRGALKGYVLSILPYPDACEDVVQETCVFLWDRRRDYQAGSSFRAWAFKAAWFKALSFRRDLQREKVVTFSEETLQRIAGAAEDFSSQADERIVALQRCVAELPEADAQLLRLKYLDRASLADHARQLAMKPNRLQKALSRLRLALRHCIERRLSNFNGPPDKRHAAS
jgi:RNA polymerase sigma-70 factor (ECF subfamily)